MLKVWLFLIFLLILLILASCLYFYLTIAPSLIIDLAIDRLKSINKKLSLIF